MEIKEAWKTYFNGDKGSSSHCIRSTPFGPLVMLWSVFGDQPKIIRVLLSRPGVTASYQVSVLFPDAIGSSCSEINVVADDIEAFLSGENIEFSLEVVCMDTCSGFRQEVLCA
ncbi:MAG: hypothetical protein JRF50_14570, partial [Deltaproteobacteria bacterium]|nr:hypothetical protein [Deltaproteobacteria bacterium]